MVDQTKTVTLIVKATAEGLDQTKAKLNELGVAFTQTERTVNAQASSLEKLAAKHDPVFRATQLLARQQVELNSAYERFVQTGGEAARANELLATSQRAVQAQFDMSVARATAGNSALLKGFGLNRVGMMELQAAGVNSFQALASGMDPLRVATMEGAQVMGALVQGGLKLSSLVPILALVTSAVGLATAGFMMFRQSVLVSEEATKIFEEAQKAGNAALLTSAELSDIAVAKKRGEARAKYDAALATSKETAALIEQELVRGQLQQRVDDLKARPDAGSSSVQRDLKIAQDRLDLLRKTAAEMREIADDANRGLDLLSDPKNLGANREQKGGKAEHRDEDIAKYIKSLQDAAEIAGQSVEQQKISVALLTLQEKGGDKVTETMRQQVIEAVKLKTFLEEQNALEAKLDEARERENAAIDDAINKRQRAVDLAKKDLELSGVPTAERAKQLEILKQQQEIEDKFPHITEEQRQKMIELAGVQGRLNAELKEREERERDFNQLQRQGVMAILDGLEQTIVKTKSWKGALQGVIQALDKIALNYANKQFASYADKQMSGSNNWMDSLFKSNNNGGGNGGGGDGSGDSGGGDYGGGADYGYSGGEYHSGGMVGEPGHIQRAISPSLFRNAPRFHSGLAPDEFPAILQTGERVMSRKEVANDRGRTIHMGDTHIHGNVDEKTLDRFNASRNQRARDLSRMLSGGQRIS